MSIVDQVKSLSIIIEDEEYHKALEQSLREYHLMIESGKMKPRDNNIQAIYKPVVFKSNY